MLMPYFVYVVLCEGGSYYTGHAKNVESRIRQHINGSGARYTRMHKPKRLVYVEEFATRRAAMRREKQIKSLRHDEKRKLATAKNSLCSKTT
jgi:putative endonuclease